MAKKLVLFDFDGTLADTIEPVRKIINLHAPSYGLKPVSEEEYQALRGMSWADILKSHHIPFYKLPFFARKIRQELYRQIDRVKAPPGMKHVMAELKKSGLHVAILTSNSIENVEKFLKNNDLGAFDFIFSDKNIFGKHMSIKKILQQTKLDPGEVVYVGDEIRDIEACKKIPIDIISVTWGFNTENFLKKYHPTALVDAPSKLIAAVKKLS